MTPPGRTAFVLGGGGLLGAVEVGMLRALFEAGVRPDVLLGTSVGALNGALVASQPELAVVDRLTELWRTAGSAREAGYGDRPLRTVRRAVSTRPTWSTKIRSAPTSTARPNGMEFTMPPSR